jgi:predicted DNA-binding transcriptional regulator AlpA
MEADGKTADRYLNVNQISNYLNRSPGAIRNLVLRRAIPFRKPVGRLLFDRLEIDEWIKKSEGIGLEQL